MSVERTGSIFSAANNNLNVSLSVTVPADADACAVLITNLTKTLNALNWDNGASVDFAEHEKIGSDDATTAWYVMTATDDNWPGSGSKTLYRKNSLVDDDYGDQIVVLFYKNVDQSNPVATGGAAYEDTSGTDWDVSVDTPGNVDAGDMTLYGITSFGSAPSPGVNTNSQTELYDNAYDDTWTGAAQKLAETEMQAGGSFDFPRGSVIVLAAAAGAVEKSASESIAFSESTGLSVGITAGESITLSEAAAVAAALTAGESMAFTEAASLAAALSAGESLTMSEAAIVAGALAASESIDMSEASGLAAALSAGEQLGMSEAAIVAAALAAADEITFTEASSLDTGLGLIQKTASESITFTEAAALSARITATEALTLTELVTIAATLAAGESITFTEAASLREPDFTWPEESEADRMEYFEDFGVTANVGGNELKVLYSAGHVNPFNVGAQAPHVLADAAEADAAGLAFGAQFSIEGLGTFKVSGPPKPDGSGLVWFKLTKLSS